MKKIPPITEEEWLLCNEFNRNMRDEFIENSTELSPKSLDSYRSNLQIWINWARINCGNKPQTEIKSRDYLKFQNWLVNMDHSSSDVANKRSAISSFNNYIALYYQDEYPTFRNFINKGIKKPEHKLVNEKNPPTMEEMEMMCEKIENNDKIKDKYMKLAYLRFTWETGCRREESHILLKSIVNAEPVKKMVKVKDKDGNIVEKEATFYTTHPLRCKGRGRTGKVRKLKFSDYSMDAIKKWLEIRGEDDNPYMFVIKTSTEVRQIAAETFNQWSTAIFSKLLGRRFHPHALRESRATAIVVEEGKSLEAAARLLGHASSETTKKHYVICDTEDDEADELFV
jgi:integrase